MTISTLDPREPRTLDVAPADPLTPGATFADRYAIESTLGEGSFTRAVLAMDVGVSPPRRVALKVARVDDGHLEREARSLRRIHERGDVPGVVRLLEPEVQRFKGASFLVLEPIEGPTLRALVAAGRRSPNELCRLGAALARALAAVHEAGVVVADLKPDNVVLRGSVEPVLVDLGAARSSDDPGAPLFLTPAYAAPEQLAGAEPTAASDVYALGVLLNELGPDGMTKLIAPCLAPDPSTRPSARALAMRLASARLPPSRRRKGKTLAALALIFAAVIVWLAYRFPCQTRASSVERSPIRLVASPLPPLHVAVDEAYVYFGDGDGGTLRRVPVTGGAAEVVARIDKPVHRIAVAPGIVYFRSGGDVWASMEGELARLYEGPGGSGGIASDVRGVVWAHEDAGEIKSLGPRGAPPLRVLAEGQAGPYDVTLDETHVYWANRGDGTILRIARDGGAPLVLARGQIAPAALAVDEEHLFWIDQSAGAVLRVKKTGGEPLRLARATIGSVGTTLDGTHVYWASLEDGRIMATRKEGGEPEILASEQLRPFDLAASREALFFTTRHERGGVMKLPRPPLCAGFVCR